MSSTPPTMWSGVQEPPGQRDRRRPRDGVLPDLHRAAHTTIVGQFHAPGGDNWGVLLSKGSGLTPCVDKAVSELQADGTLAALNKRWIASEASVSRVLH